MVERREGKALRSSYYPGYVSKALYGGQEREGRGEGGGGGGSITYLIQNLRSIRSKHKNAAHCSLSSVFGGYLCFFCVCGGMWWVTEGVGFCRDIVDCCRCLAVVRYLGADNGVLLHCCFAVLQYRCW